VASAGLSESKKHARIVLQGISIRFPRLVRVRDDKTPEQATSATQVPHHTCSDIHAATLPLYVQVHVFMYASADILGVLDACAGGGDVSGAGGA
jgi:hypothetical protein